MSLILPQVPMQQWRQPSAGHAPLTLQRLTVRLHDGHIRWRGWFESRDDADAFLYELVELGHPSPSLWRLPTPWWDPYIEPGLVYEFATEQFLTTPNSLQTWVSPVDWNNSNNTIELLGGGATGAFAYTEDGGARTATGGGGGQYAKKNNFNVATPGVTDANYLVGPGGRVDFGGTFLAGNNGGDTWFNGLSVITATTWAGGGQGGLTSGGSGARSGGAGGSGGSGDVLHNGGRGGNVSGNTSSFVATGGGGAAGLNGAGSNGQDRTTNLSFGSSGGVADAGGTGAGTGGVGGPAPITGGNGGNGWEWQHGSVLDGPDYGSGGGGAGTSRSGSSVTAGGAGGSYGAGGGGCCALIGALQGAGTQGIIVVTYTPLTTRRGGLLAAF